MLCALVVHTTVLSHDVGVKSSFMYISIIILFMAVEMRLIERGIVAQEEIDWRRPSLHGVVERND